MHLTVIKCLKPSSFWGLRPLDPTAGSKAAPECLFGRYKKLKPPELRPLDPTPISVLPVSQIRF